MVQASKSGGVRSRLRSRPSSASPDGSDDLVVALFNVIRHSRRPLASDELDPPAVVVLASAERLDPARPSDIACDVKLNLSTVSRHLSNLEAGGYIARTDDPDDRRAQRVRPTERGLECLRASLASRSEVLNAATTQWSDDDRETLTDLVSRLADDLSDIATERRTGRKDPS